MELTNQAAFCTLTLELGPDFVNEPPWSEELSKVSSGKLKFSRLLELVAEKK